MKEKISELITKYAISEYEHIANEPQFDGQMVDIFREDLISLLEEYAEQFKTNWIPISEYPENNPNVIRWHKIWKCAIPVKKANHNARIPWVECTLSLYWPEESFEPFFTDMLPKPEHHQ